MTRCLAIVPTPPEERAPDHLVQQALAEGNPPHYAAEKQLATLRKDGYAEQQRTYPGRVPKTTVRATDGGRRRFLRHTEALRTIVERAPVPGER
jgi:hypothetical protein